MAPPSRTVATSSSARHHAQPRPPLSREYVNAHPEYCLAPRILPISLPEQAQPAWQSAPHIAYPSAYIQVHAGGDARGALHLVSGSQVQASGGTPCTGQYPNAPSCYYPPACTPVNAVPLAPPPPYPSDRPPISVHVAPPVQSSPIPIPKPRYSTSPPTPESTPPRPAVTSSRRKRTSADDAQHGASPIT